METEEVILVDEHNHALGSMEKMEAHRKGLLHRAFSVFVFNDKGELLLQQRAASKYHSPLLWTNTCCSHPRPGEDTLQAANRRLKEEMGIAAELALKGDFIYKATFGNGLIEHEFDYVFTGISNAQPNINKEEVENFDWQSLDEIKTQLKSNPEKFTVWFKIAVERWF